MSTITVHTPARRVTAPRGAVFAAWLFRLAAGAIEGLAAAARRRQERRQANHRMADAAQLRRYAQSVMQFDARFAADLFAAADRHDQGK
ncbi:MAG: hypothetical protein H7Z19_08505 [Chitinophagaceae bacterium]|nr:hypothetical protein [Rubrivivax sp.]